MVSARDEATPPEFKELVERYYEVLSKKQRQQVNTARMPASRGSSSGLESIEETGEDS